MEKSGIDAVRRTFGKRLHTILDARGLPATGFARSRYISDLIGVTTPTSYKYLTGVFMPGYDILIDLARKLNVTPDYLIGIESLNSYLLYDPTGLNPIHMTLPDRIKEFSTAGWVGLFFYWHVAQSESFDIVKTGDIIVYTTQNSQLADGQHYIVRYENLMYIARAERSGTAAAENPLWKFHFEDNTFIELAERQISHGYAEKQASGDLGIIGTPVYRFPAGHAFPI
jgi:transcriptional regulator with XRE-family HTH domain